MAVITKGRLAEEILKLLSGGEIQAAGDISLAEIKVSIGQVINQLLKVDYFSTNMKMGEVIPNGAVLGLYEGIAVSSHSNGTSKSTLPIKPLKLPRNMGVFSVYRTNDPTNEFIPLQMGQSNLLKSQPMINNLLGQIGYECFGNVLVFTKNIPQLFPDETLSMRLAVMDMDQYGDYDILPVLPEQEWTIKQEVFKLYSEEPIADKLVDSSVSEQQNVPIKDQQQT